ncbi:MULTISPECIES: hypothetical protein [Streptacidiphilus]|uniref:Uncharacterized protein n=1 Tax=Streptacidiphilus cavernicola TaxID=3342716 RepID=A0ABV6URI6_9ACTN|nr:hypothetical protein [Streptacidiphilus jeojiense]
MPFEDELTEALNDTAHSFQPDLTSLVNAGVGDGRRRNRRRRALGVLGTVTALAVVGVGGTFASGALSSDQGTGKSAGHSVATGKPAKVQVADAAPVSAQEMVAKLESLLPHGTFSRATGTGTEEGGGSKGGGAGAYLVFQDGHGAVQVSVNVEHHYASAADASGQLSCPSKIDSPYDICSVKRNADGSVLVVHQSHEYTNDPGSTKEWFAVLTRRDGSQVTFDELNSDQEKGAAATRTDPPLSPAAMAALVGSDTWAPVIAALPAPASQPGSGSGSGSGSADPGSGAQVLAKLRSLLPSGVGVSQTRTDSGFAEVLLTDGKGSGFLTVSVVPESAPATKPGQSGPPAADPFAGATKLSDGSLLLVKQQQPEKGPAGVLQWSAYLKTAKGTVVYVDEYNDKAYQTPKDRAVPVLTIAQLKQLVTSPVWGG